MNSPPAESDDPSSPSPRPQATWRWIRKRPKRMILLLLIVIAYLMSNTVFRVMTWGVDVAYLDIEFRGPSAEKTIYLTIDDGPSMESTETILEVLKKHDVPATFFIAPPQSQQDRRADKQPLKKRIPVSNCSLSTHDRTSSASRGSAARDRSLLI